MVFSKKRCSVLAVLIIAVSLSSCIRKKYENPITKDTQQPDKVLFDKAIGDIEHGRYEVARLTLNTMINTYDTSEYLAKAKLAVADSWYREGGAHGLAQAEAEYKDFILFYPQMEESAESQWKICQIHYKQMEKADRDPMQAQRAEEECRNVLTNFPNSKYIPQAKQMLRNVQEDLALKEFLTGSFYHSRQAFPAATARLKYVVDQYPLFSQADEALWQLADSYNRLGDRWEDKAADAYTRIVKDYPLSIHAEDAAAKLKALNRPVPAADPTAVARMKYNEENKTRTSTLGHVTGPLMTVISHNPDTRAASKIGDPAMQNLRPPTPISVPQPNGGAPGTSGGDVTVSQAVNSDIDNKPDARAGGGAPAGTPIGGTAAGGTAASGSNVTAKPGETNPAATNQTAGQAPLPTNYQTLTTKQQKKAAAAAAKKAKKQPKNAVNSPETIAVQQQQQATTPPATTPGSTAAATAGTDTPAPKTAPDK
jgi:outer membrane protein assembly factor BamD